jgi:hypothetical protein
MGFFDEAVAAANARAAADAEAEIDTSRPWIRNNADIAMSVPIDGLLWSDDRAAIALSGVGALPNGFRFTVNLRWRERDPQLGRGRRGRLRRPWLHGRPGPVVRLILGDGQSIGADIVEPDDSQQPRLVPQGSSATATSVDHEFWVSPLPPPGPLVLALDWPQYDLVDLRVEIDSQLIRDAAARCPRLWEETA